MAARLAKCSDVPEGKALIVNDSQGRELFLVKQDGVIHAYENVCPHMGGPVGEGEIENGRITCPWHSWQFNLQDGQCETMCGEELTKIPIRIDGDDIYLE